MTSSKPILLVTTAIEASWGNDEEILFLGQWCLLYERRYVWGKRDHSVAKNHWDDRNKLRQDYDRLKDLHEILLGYLASALNRYHKLEKSLRYWRMILDPWLLTYIAVIFDRWECLRTALKGTNQFETLVLSPLTAHQKTRDYNDFIKRATGDAWNYQLFLEIIQSTYANRCSLLEANYPEQQDSEARFNIAAYLKQKLRATKRKIAADVDCMFGKLFPRSRVVFYESYFPGVALTKLCIKIGQFPRLFQGEFERPLVCGESDKLCTTEKRQGDFDICIDPTSDFEAFLFTRIAGDIPITYVEGFPALRERCEKISMRPKAIFTGTGHWGNELFKLWSAEQVSQGCKLITIQHGGSINSGTMTAMNFEEDIADYFVTPSIPCHPKHVQLPFVKLAGVEAIDSGRFCSLLAFEGQRYSLRAEAWPISGQALVNYHQSIEFYKGLRKNIQEKFRVRPHSGQAWNTRARYADDIGGQVLNGKTNYYDFLAESRIIVCTYPNTTFAEAIATGLPTILLYPGELWELNPASLPLLKVLMAARIVFHDHQAAAAHINSVWENPGEWWSCRETAFARSEFHRQAVYLSADWINPWLTFVNRVTA